MLASLAVTEAKAADRPAGALLSPAVMRRGARRGSRSRPKPEMADEAVDQWRKPYERSGNTKAMMQEYLDWEVDLLPRIERDGSLQFERFRPRLPTAAR